MKQRSAFTLIELLIVVAIIGILAAIAIPNFMEAQVRAKVARVKSDMRTVATAIEMYRVDHNMHPPGIAPQYESQWGFGPPWVSSWLLEAELASSNYIVGPGWYLTTPVSYLSSIPRDNWMETYFSLFNTELTRGSFFYRCVWGEGYESYSTFPARVDIHDDPHVYMNSWWLESPGPNCICWHTPPDDAEYFYDPTNGTVSNGDIVWFEKEGLKGGS